MSDNYGRGGGASERGRRKKLIDWIEFSDDWNSSSIQLDDGRTLTKCDQCRDMWLERNERGVEGEPPCETCIIKQIPENQDAHMIFNLTRQQFIMGGMGGPVAVNHLSIHEAMRLYRIKDKRRCFEKVLILCNWWIKKLNKKDD